MVDPFLYKDFSLLLYAIVSLVMIGVSIPFTKSACIFFHWIGLKKVLY
jgi:hypothetical protein